ncbi:uncharacterized protein LOC114363619 isoform X2 [Ostrinia furnacalis]|uniref:uncharacterized protein LOC114363619 isoform X2 n=1 Tax=Ostrinia furnacalis TaxID=93504 RepID=UPI00103D7D34|nr:uncharacterized protein LOC114363619 isoform X2 [Ostrinia furnacalis]
MNDPWDVKSVRQSGQYVSCMRINGVPLLPPVLSKECRKEMQYYKLLAKEVEKRISLLKPYIIDTDSDSSEDKTDAPELPENEQSYELPQEEIQAGFNINIDKIVAVTNETTLEKSILNSPPPCSITTDFYNNITSNVTVSNTIATPTVTSSPKKFVIDLSLSINETGRNVLETLKKSPQHSSPPIDLPERDYDSPKNVTQKEVLTDVESCKKSSKQQNKTDDIVNFSFSIDKDILSDPFPDLSINQDGPSSLSSKSFTGSLIDIHTESMKESQIGPQLIRQRSYTLLKPSPQLLAHLEVQSMNTGIDMSCISMSESFSNLSSPGKKRRSWDLESAKVKWSSMALELNQKNVINAAKVNGVNKTNVAKPIPKKTQQPSPQRSRSVVQEKTRRPNMPTKPIPKSEPIQKQPPRKSFSPVRNVPTTRAVPIKEPVSTKTPNSSQESVASKPSTIPISESEDPAARVRELYEKIQKQQLIQMANLVEKQKKEQQLLQQVFEEQNNILYKQLKTICPKSPVEAKEAWADKNNDRADRGPVSLSQLINHKTPESSGFDSPVSVTLTETNNYINHCDDVLKRSKDITSNIKKQQPIARPQNGAKTSSPRIKTDGSRTRTHSPTSRNTSRRLNYDTSASSERDFEPLLTDRTNDTMADLNVTFPSDHSEDGHSIHNGTVINKDITVVHRAPLSAGSGHHSRTPDVTLRSLEEPLQTPMSICRRPMKQFVSQPTAEQRAAATKIVAFAKGFLVRRLLRTDRVQGTVQTIRDALLCALQLHQEREGIRGADVGLHRRLIQQITAACYALHDTFITSTPAERCAMIAADRGRRRALAARPPPPRAHRPTDI